MMGQGSIPQSSNSQYGQKKNDCVPVQHEWWSFKIDNNNPSNFNFFKCHENYL